MTIDVRSFSSRVGATNFVNRVSETVVLTEFLRNELVGGSPSDPDRDLFRQLACRLHAKDGGVIRACKSLRLLRRYVLWSELPNNTRWWSVSVGGEDLDEMMVFSRGKLTRSVGAQLRLRDFAERIRSGRVSDRFGEIAKIRLLARNFVRQEQRTAILLLGTSEKSPFTVLDGNHRIIAALLSAPDLIPAKFDFFCGLSPRMSQCLWHNMTMFNFCAYAWRRLGYMLYSTAFSSDVVLKQSRNTSGVCAPAPFDDESSPTC